MAAKNSAELLSLTTVHQSFIDSFTIMDAPLEGLEEIIAEDVMGYGTTKDEKIFELAGFLKLVQLQRDQSYGMQISIEQEAITRKIDEKNGSALFVDEVKATMKLEDGSEIIIPLRLSVVLSKSPNWKVVHWHGSQAVETESDPLHKEEWKKKREELEAQVAVKTADLVAKNRELSIEAALERVRSRTMAMLHSDELTETSFELFEQFKVLGKTSEQMSIGIFDDEQEVLALYSTRHGIQWKDDVTIDLNEPVVMKKMYAAWEKKEKSWVIDLNGDELDQYNVYRKKLSDLDYPEKRWVIHSAFFSKGVLTYSDTEPLTNETIEILVRFAGVFNQTYTRFLDLKKAEAQAREAQVEAALERVRAQSLAMKKSEDLAELSRILVQQVQELGVKTWFCAFNIYDNDAQGSWEWGSNGKGAFPNYRTPLEGIFLKYYEAGRKGETLLINEIGPDECPSHYEYLCSLPGVGDQLLEMKAQGIPFPTAQIDHVAYFDYGYLLFITYDATPASHDIFIRFAKVFELSYTRFLDLQKAEQQAREAHIEAALERTRSMALAMRESSDLFDIVVSMRQEFITLGHEADYFWHMEWLPDRYAMSMTSESGNRLGMVINVPRFVHDEIDSLHQWEQSDSLSFVLALDAKDGWDYIDKMNTHGHYEKVDPHAPTKEDIEHIGGITFIIARTTHGEIGFSLAGEVPNPPKESIATLERFAGVFDLAYQRFVDLMNVEAQAKEAKVEVALERIRAQALSMRQSTDLLDIVVAMRTEFVNLGYEAHYFWYMRWLPEKYEKAMTSGDGSRIGMVMELPRRIHGEIESIKSWEESSEPSLVHPMNVEEALDYVHKMAAWGDFKQIDPNMPTDDDLKHIGGLTYVMARTTYGEIGYSLPGFVSQSSQEARETLIRFAGVFDLAYQRFEDLQRSETQALKIREERDTLQQTLKELKSTQSQLIHSEKMASLGELTAGIAHEIQNPLNFVNNFSDLNKELIADLKEAVANNDQEEVKAILTDLEENERKVTHHGQRAEQIVKSMLQHSRTSSGEKELTDINALCDEYLRLSYHGFRAKDKSFNSDFKLELDKSLLKVDVVPQDIGRVLLNLLNNAFQVVHGQEEALVKLTTQKINDQVQITISDNGPGIPNNIKDKIFQPFFTTKPTGEGTGLGLSMSYDIVTKGHGGTIEVFSEEIRGTIFTINIPTT